MYLVVEWGPEGIEELIYLTPDKKNAIDKVEGLRADIELAKYIRADIDDEKWMEMELANEIDWDTWRYGCGSVNPKDICVQYWDGSKFYCDCRNLGLGVH